MPLANNPFVNLLRPGGTWTTGGPGTATVNAETGQIAITADGTANTFVRRAVNTTVNKRYQLTWSCDTSAVTFRTIGATVNGTEIAGQGTTVAGDNKTEFNAISTTTYITFQRLTAATVRTSSPILEEIPAGDPGSRRLNGVSQYFSLDAQTAGLRLSNANWYIGGWIAFTYIPTTPVYLMDFGRLDPTSTAGGAGRIRLFWDPDNTKLAVSTAETTSTNYRENYIITTLQPDTWYYIAVRALANADVTVNLGTTRGASYIGTTLPPVSGSEICRFLQLGARVVTARANFSPCRYSNWIWCSNFIPSDSQIAELADGKVPSAITGFTVPTGANLYHWPMTVSSGNEPSIRDTAVLTANSGFLTPITVTGPVQATAATASTTPLDIMVV